MTEIIPLHDKVVVQKLEEKDIPRNGIYTPDNAKEKPQEGKVLAVGDGRYESGVLIPLSVKVGDTVLFGKYSGSDIEIDGEKFLILGEDEILAKLKTKARKAGA